MPHQIKRILSFSIGLCLSLYSIWLISLEKIHFGVLVHLVIGFVLCIYSIFYHAIQVWITKNRFRTQLCRFIWIGFFAWLLSLVLFFGYIQFNKEFNTQNQTPKAIIVLGGGVENAQPTPSLANRLDAAIVYAHAKPSTLIIVSGGLVFGEDYTEAEIMKNYIVQHYPILKNPIKTENRSTSTELNLAYSEKVLSTQGISKSEPIAIVSSDFHLPRAKAIAAQQGYGNIITVSSETPLYIRYHSWLREYFAYLSGWLLNEY